MIFKGVPTYEHARQYARHPRAALAPLKRYIVKCLHLDPCSPELRKDLLGWLATQEKANNLNVKKIRNALTYKVESALTMNQDEVANATHLLHKKNIILGNLGDKNAWVGFISHQWSTKRDTKWVEALKRVLEEDRKGEGRLSGSSKLKAETMLI